jgi:replicative DNA helicase
MNDTDALALAQKEVERIPGANAEALAIERAVLGAMLLDTRGPRAWPTLVADHFFLHRHKLIFQALLDLTEVTDRPDTLGLMAELARREELEEVGGHVTIAGLLEEGCGVVDLQRYGGIIRTGHSERLRRELAAAVLRSPGGSSHVDEILRSLEDQPGIAEGLAPVFARLAASPSGTLLETGLKPLDERSGGLRLGQVTVVGGRTSHGKTALCCDIAVRLAEQDYPVDFVTLEDPPEAIAARMIASRAARSVWYVRFGRLAGLDAQREALEALPLQIVSVPGCREAAVLGAIASSSATVVVLDHLQHIEMGDDDEKRVSALDRIMGRLVAIARRDGKAIIASAQLNREMEKVKREPQLSDLRDSGAIEQKARQVWLIYWPAKHDTKKDPADVMVKVEKNTEGPTGRALLKWDARSGRYWDPRDEDAKEANAGW